MHVYRYALPYSMFVRTHCIYNLAQPNVSSSNSHVCRYDCLSTSMHTSSPYQTSHTHAVRLQTPCLHARLRVRAFIAPAHVRALLVLVEGIHSHVPSVHLCTVHPFRRTVGGHASNHLLAAPLKAAKTHAHTHPSSMQEEIREGYTRRSMQASGCSLRDRCLPPAVVPAQPLLAHLEKPLENLRGLCAQDHSSPCSAQRPIRDLTMVRLARRQPRPNR